MPSLPTPASGYTEVMLSNIGSIDGLAEEFELRSTSTWDRPAVPFVIFTLK